MKRELLTVILAIFVNGCTTLDTWYLDDPAGDAATVKRLEERMDRFLRSADVEGDLRQWYTVNGYYLVVKTPFYLRTTFRTRIPYVACSGVDNESPEKIERACRLLDLPVEKER